MSDDGHVSGAVALSQAGKVLAEGDVEDPVKRVLDAPVGADGFAELFGGERPGGNVKAPVDPGLGLGFDLCLDHGDGGEFGQAVLAGEAAVALQPVDLAADAAEALFDAAMALVDIAWSCRAAGLAGIVEEALDLGMKARLVGLDGEQVVGAGSTMALAMSGLQAMASMVTRAPAGRPRRRDVPAARGWQ